MNGRARSTEHARKNQQPCRKSLQPLLHTWHRPGMDELQLESHALDLTVPCGCGAGPGVECRGARPGVVHFGRRVDRMLTGFIAEHERARRSR